MTDDKGSGEGPYKYHERADGRFIIEGPGVHMDGGPEHLTRNEVCRLNMVFALGLQRGCTAGCKSERDRVLEGPYRKITHYTKSETGEPRIDAYGDGVRELDVSKSDGNGILRLVNAAHAEGREAAEKDFNELLDIANRMVAPSGTKFQAVTDFMFWKKARGIE